MATRAAPSLSKDPKLAREQADGSQHRRFGFQVGAITTPGSRNTESLEAGRFFLCPLTLGDAPFVGRSALTYAADNGSPTMLRFTLYRVQAPLKSAWSARKTFDVEIMTSGSGAYEWVEFPFPFDVVLDRRDAFWLVGLSGEAINDVAITSGVAIPAGFYYTPGGIAAAPDVVNAVDFDFSEVVPSIQILSRPGRALLL